MNKVPKMAPYNFDESLEQLVIKVLQRENEDIILNSQFMLQQFTEMLNKLQEEEKEKEKQVFKNQQYLEMMYLDQVKFDKICEIITTKNEDIKILSAQEIKILELLT